MIQLTRLRHDDVFYVNPDLIERVDTHVDTVVRLTCGTEYVVEESGETILQRIAEFRAKVLALVPVAHAELRHLLFELQDPEDHYYDEPTGSVDGGAS